MESNSSVQEMYQPLPSPIELEPEPMQSEIRAAIKKLKYDKAAGLDGIYGEMIQMVETIIDQIWKTGDWLREWTQSEIITLPKVPGTQDCSKHRTISLISHSSKELLEILRCRIAHYMIPHIAEEQFGFVTWKATTDAILMIRNITEKTIKRQDQELWMMYVDYSKAFETVQHTALWKSFLEFGTPDHLVWLLEKLYIKANGVISGYQKTKQTNFS